MNKRIHILVVDDASFIRDLVKRGVRAGFPGFAVTEASNGRQAKAKLVKGGFDIVLCDWEMPEMAGDELLEWMRSEPSLADTPFIMITSRGDKEHVVRALDLGATNYIVKPFTNEKLLDVMGRTLCKSMKISPRELKRLGSPEVAFQSQPHDPAVSGLSADLTGIAQTLSAEKSQAAAPRKERAAPKKKVVTQVRFSNRTCPCLVKEVDFTQLVGIIKQPETPPRILEQATFDFSTQDEKVSRINAYLHALEAGEDRQDTEYLRITLRFVDDDPAKRDHLAQYFGEIDG